MVEYLGGEQADRAGVITRRPGPALISASNARKPLMAAWTLCPLTSATLPASPWASTLASPSRPSLGARPGGSGPRPHDLRTGLVGLLSLGLGPLDGRIWAETGVSKCLC